MNDVMQLSLSALDRGLVQGDIKAFWTCWRDLDTGAQDLRLLHRYIADRTTLSAGTASSGLSPRLLVVGPQSFVAECYGAAWARSAIVEEHTPDTDLERSAARGYHAAIAGEPNLDIMSVRTRDLAGREMDLLYERLILPLRTANGSLLIGCVTAKLMPIRWIKDERWEQLRGRARADRWHDGIR
ncbi:hypothetical protein LC092_08425 [Stappia stellulata]|uniref:hypothetical protein n=1 Tax=Stappia stellulata TaxID=71235 RepID=UPI001CD60348|nr:hypothetical protein [Stappia stellulata]MCA1242461.1 hypothetical protein [Stappia stellulata]